MNRFRFLFLLFCGTARMLVGQPAESVAESPQRTTIDSDRLEMQGTEEHNYFYFGGNVQVKGTDLEIRCDELTVRARRGASEKSTDNSTIGELGAVEEIVAIGNVRINQAGREATAGRVVVDPLAGTIHFLENPVIVQGDMRATAYGYIFYTAEKRFEAMNPPGFVPGEQGRSRISLSNLPAITVEVPEDSLSLGEGSTAAAGNGTALPVAAEDATERPVAEEEADAETEETPAPADPAEGTEP